MTRKRVVLRSLAEQDVEDACSYYLDAGGVSLRLEFVDALERTLDLIARNPPAGSPRYAVDLNLPELRCWLLKDFPYVVFYVERAESIDVWRMLHGKRDVPESLR
jgi:toxin ParE1/3/4